MHLYQGTREQFIADAVRARLGNQLAERVCQAGMSEVRAWQNSHGAMAQILRQVTSANEASSPPDGAKL